MTTIDMHLFTKDYYEDGVRKHISGYENYSWQPTRSIPEALDIQNYFDFDTCVDYGCAKGFLVHALRILGSRAYGEDMSEYAIENCHPAVKDYLSLPNKKIYDLLICKDMLEHVEEDLLFYICSNRSQISSFLQYLLETMIVSVFVSMKLILLM